MGRIAIPHEIRNRLGIKEGMPLELYVDGDTIVYKIYNDGENLLNIGEHLLKTLKNKVSYDNNTEYEKAINITKELITVLQKGTCEK